MADEHGWPDADDCLRKVELISGEASSEALRDEVGVLLTAVIAEFESPVGPGGRGGTGRRFTAVTETRSFDGNGYNRLRVDDIVPGSLTSVALSGAALANVELQQTRPGRGYNLLVRTGGGLVGGLYGYDSPGVFPLGVRNVAVSATWGYAETVPADVAEAVRCEVAFRALTAGVIGLGGAQELKKQGDVEFFQARVSENTNPVPLLHQAFLDAIARYREDKPARHTRAAAVIS